MASRSYAGFEFVEWDSYAKEIQQKDFHSQMVDWPVAGLPGIAAENHRGLGTIVPNGYKSAAGLMLIQMWCDQADSKGTSSAI